MRMYIWNVLWPEYYSGSIVYAVAENVDDARREARAAKIQGFGEFSRDRPTSLLMDIDREPDRILDLPCAEIYEWEE